jgi:hypothetical protein
MIKEIASDEETASLFALVGLNPEDYAKAVVGVMSLACGDVTINGDKAVAEVIITLPDYEAISTEMDKALDEALAEMDESTSEEEALAAVGDAMMKALENTPSKTETIKADYVKNNGKWEIADASKLTSAMEQAFAYQL